MSDTSKTELGVRDIVDLEAFIDPRFRDELQQDPAGAMGKLAEKYGIDIPAGVTCRVLSDTDSEYHLVLSNNPAGDAPATAGSEVSGYMDMIAAPTSTSGQPNCTKSLFCNPAISKAMTDIVNRTR